MLGLITNRRSRRNGDWHSMPQSWDDDSDIVHAHPDTPEALSETLADFGRRGIGVIAVAGGDGTLHQVLTALARAEGVYHPEIALLPAGKTNLAAHAIGSAGPGKAGLARLTRALRCGTTRGVRVPAIEIRWPFSGRAPVRGFLFGTGSFESAVEFANRRIFRTGVTDGPAVALAIGASILRLLVGRGRPLRDERRMDVKVDGQALAGERHFLLLATTLRQLAFRVDPFWNTGAEPIRWLDIAAPPRRILSALVPVLRGRPRPWMKDAGYRSGSAERILVTLDGSFILDGEVFQAEGGIEIAHTPPIGFVVP